MSLFALAWRSVRGRPLASALTVISVALGVALVIALLSLRASTRRSFLEAGRGYDVILGPTEGGPLDTVMNTLFHIGEAKGTIPWDVYEDIAKDPRVRYAVPYAVGDSFRGHHVLGTTPDLFKVLMGTDDAVLGEGVEGRIFRPGRFEAVIGSVVAAKTGLRRGVSFRVMHGVEFPTHEHVEDWEVVGILRPTGTPSDRAIFIPLKTFYAIGGHGEGAEAIQKRREEKGEVVDKSKSAEEVLGLSAIGVRLVSPGLRLNYVGEMQQDRDDLDPIQPIQVISELLNVVSSVDRVFEILAWVNVVVSALGILVGLYNTIHGRRREIAILRSLGARGWHVFLVIVLEALLLVLAGGLIGLIAGHLAIAAAAPTLLHEYAIRANPAPGMHDVLVLSGLALLGLIAGAVPALRGLRTPVAQNLHPQDA